MADGILGHPVLLDVGEEEGGPVELVRRERIPPVFFERLVSPRLAKTIARDAGATARVLDPIEGLTPAEERRGQTYFTLMRQNLSELRTALGCR